MYAKESDFRAIRWLEFTRYYNSQPLIASDTLGYSWRHTYSRSISYDPAAPTIAKALHADGRARAYTRTSNTWTSGGDVNDVLTWQTDTNGAVLGWTLVRADTQETEHYSSSGKLIAIVDARGFQSLLAYSDGATPPAIAPGIGFLVSVTDPIGRSLRFAYDSQGRLTTMTDPSGQTFAYAYGPSNYSTLATVTYPGTTGPRTYIYNEPTYTGSAILPHSITGIVDEAGNRYATYTYDSRGAATSNWLGTGVSRYDLLYNSDNSVDITDPLGTTSRNGFAVVQGVVLASGQTQPLLAFANAASRTYDAQGKPKSVTDFNGNSTCYTHDANRGLETSRILGVTGACSAATYGERRIETDWDTAERLALERRTFDPTGALKARKQWRYNARSQVSVECDIDPTDPVAMAYSCSATTAPQATAKVRRSTLAYCEAADVAAPGSTCPILGLLKSVDGSRADVSDVTTYIYYPSNHGSCAASPTTCPHRKGDLWKVTNALGHVTETLSYDGAGRVLSSKDANAVITDLTYHPRGWLTARKVRGADNATEIDDAITRFDYWPTGLVKRVAQPDGDYLVYEYDAAHRLTAIEDALANRIEYTLDAAGNRTNEHTKDAGGAIKRQLSRVFDQLGRLDLEKNAAQLTIADHGYDANGNVTSTVDALSHETQQAYDPLGRLRQTIQDYAGLNVTTGYTYDALDRLTTVTDPKGLDTNYTYSGLGDLSQLSSPDTGITGYTYDSSGNRLTQTDARGITATYTYDALNRLTSIVYPNAALNVGYGYDQTNASTGCGTSFPMGRLTRMTDASGSTTYCYDHRGNVIRKTQISAGQTLTIGYDYTVGDRLAAITYPSGKAVAFERDANGRVIVAAGAGKGESIVTDVQYLPFGRATQIAFEGRTTLDFAYDSNYSIDAITGTALNLDLGTDAIGNIVSLSDASPTAARAYDYDPLSRLTGVEDGNAALIEAFGYDSTGNRLSKQTSAGTQSYAYPAASHRLASIDSTPRNYDAVGALTDRGNGWTFEYDVRQRLKTARLDGSTRLVNTYNGKGERVSKSNGLGGPLLNRTTFAYDEAGQLLGEYDRFGAVREYVWLDERPVAILNRDDEVLHLHTDHLGTPRAITRPADDNMVVWRWDLSGSAFGEHAPDQDPDGDGLSFEFNLRYPGQYFDQETGLHYNYLRDGYEAGTGRYTQSDPIGLYGGLTTYGYSNLSPLQFSDSLGLDANGACCRSAEAEVRRANPSARGFVACCGGSRFSCVIDDPQDNPSAQRVKQTCRRKHEDVHRDDLERCVCQGDGRPAGAAPSAPGSGNQNQADAECAAYSISLPCFLNQRSSCRNNSRCLESLNREINHQRSEFTRFCGSKPTI